MAGVTNLTDTAVRNVKAGTARIEVSDGRDRKLRLVIHPSGAKTWVWRGRIAGDAKIVKKTLGSYPAHSLSDAREWGDRLTREAARGVDVVATERADRAAQIEAAKASKVADEAESQRAAKTLNWYWQTHYRPAYVERLKDKRETIRMWDRLIAPRIGSMIITDVEHEDVDPAVKAIAVHAPVTARRALSMMKTMFRRAASVHRTETGLRASPVETVILPPLERAAKRALSEDELSYVLAIVDHLDGGKDFVSIYASVLRLIVATGVRISEANDAAWSEIDFDRGLWEIPAARSKNGLAHIVPLSAPLKAWLEERKRATNSSYVFPSPRSEGPLGSASKPQARVEKLLSERAAADGITIEGWSAHDLRRTFSTRLNALTDDDLSPVVPTHVVEQLLNHQSGSAKAGVAGVYNQYGYLREKRTALLIWEDYLDTLRKRVAMEEPARLAA